MITYGSDDPKCRLCIAEKFYKSFQLMISNPLNYVINRDRDVSKNVVFTVTVFFLLKFLNFIK